MITKENLEGILNELLCNQKISDFAKKWLLHKTDVTEESIKECYYILKEEVRATNERIAKNAHLLGEDPSSLRESYEDLEEAFGLSRARIAKHIELLGKHPEARKETARVLKQEFGLSRTKIASRAELLGRDVETLRKNQRVLKKMVGVSVERIGEHAELLGLSPVTIQRHYQQDIGVLREVTRESYKDKTYRESGRKLLRVFVQLLGNAPVTIEDNVQFMYAYGIHYNGVLLGTRVQTKRKKMAWILREGFRYKALPEEEKRLALNNIYGFIREHPRYLRGSIDTLEEKKEKIQKEVREYLQKQA